MVHSVVEFLNGTGRDGRGRSLDDILAMSDAELEQRHDFIQWLFPLTRPSAAVPSSPVLDDDAIDAIRRDATAQANLVRALERMTQFYRRNNFWLTPHNHNHRRISRIVASMNRLGDPALARDFLTEIRARAATKPGAVDDRTLLYWDMAENGRL